MSGSSTEIGTPPLSHNARLHLADREEQMKDKSEQKIGPFMHSTRTQLFA